jgi:hypothetical protein
MPLISKYEEIFNPEGTVVELYSELEKFRSGGYKGLVQSCRQALAKGNRELFEIRKKKLPAITISGVFGKTRRVSSLKTYSGMIVLDMDGLPKGDIDAWKRKLEKDPYMHACWKSPSGLGLKCIIRVADSSRLHKINFDNLVNYFSSHYGAQIDRSGSDIPRLCYVSYDPGLFLNLRSQAFSSKIPYPLPGNQKKATKGK